MGFQVGQACYATESAAASASASAVLGTVVQHGGSAFVVNVTGVSSTSITYSFAPIDGGTALVVTAPYTAQACGLLGVEDAVQIGWLIGGAWVATYCVMFLARALRGVLGQEPVEPNTNT